jgi:formate/nitrite transporter FocA (FNT family)
MAITFNMGFSKEPNAVGQRIGQIGEARTLGYAAAGSSGLLTVFIRAVMCNWMVSTGVVAAIMSSSVSGKIMAMWMPIIVFVYLGFEHPIVNMFLFPSGIMRAANSLGSTVSFTQKSQLSSAIWLAA